MATTSPDDRDAAFLRKLLERRGIEDVRPEDEARVLELLRQGKQIEAVEFVRGRWSSALSAEDALHIVDTVLMARGAAEETRAGTPWQLLQQHGIEDVTPEDEAQLLNLLQQGQKILAIKYVRERWPGVGGLKEAKDLVEALATGLGISPQAKSGCFIATAACGTPFAPEVVCLRAFRETVLRPTRAGRGFIRCYEAVSPPLARMIGRSAALRRLARTVVVGPAAALACKWLGDR